MKRIWSLNRILLLISMIPIFACGPMASRVTPTPTKTPKIARIETRIVTDTPTATPIVINTPTPIPTDTPVPPTDTPTPEPTATDTPTPEPTPTNPPPPPPPPPPPTNTPVPPPPAEPPPPPPPPEPPSSKPEVYVELPDGNTHDKGDEFEVRFIIRDPDGVESFTWGIFTQNQTSLIGGTEQCGNRIECVHEEEVASPLPGVFIIGADAVDSKGQTARGIGEIYIR